MIRVMILTVSIVSATIAFAHDSKVETIEEVAASGAHSNSAVGGKSLHNNHAHNKVVNMLKGKAPSLMLEVNSLRSGGHTLKLETTNFRFSKEHADGVHVAGEGHAHLYVDGKKLRRIYTNYHDLAPLPPGVHEVKVSLYTNDHAAYHADGMPVSDITVVRVGAENK